MNRTARSSQNVTDWIRTCTFVGRAAVLDVKAEETRFMSFILKGTVVHRLEPLRLGSKHMSLNRSWS
ncbi:hypothetical protein E3U43_003052 [Larimichthys crocea]|nr:hypothetical protein E3U43_003052 [Larimichthys crocea]